MLVLTRSVGEAVVIPKHMIRVTVTRMEDGRVRLGFEAPAGTDIIREELLHRVVDENRARDREGAKRG